MRHERSSHIVSEDLPQSAGLSELTSSETDELHLRSSHFIGNHICIVEHSRHILLQELVSVRDDVLLREVLLRCCRILVHEYALRGVLLVV